MKHSPWSPRRAGPGFEMLETRLLLSADIRISEFLADNQAGISDADGDRSDWIELYNATASSVNLNGWYLTDIANNLTKWQFPSTTLPAGGYLVVFASGKNRAVSGSEWHTNFALNKDGGYLGLVDPDGQTVVSSYAAYPAQKADVSYGVGGGGLLTSGAPARAIVPWDSSYGTSWRSDTYLDNSWPLGTTGVGYDFDTSGAGYSSLIGLDVKDQMWSPLDGSMTNLSCYIRVPFYVSNSSILTSMTLRMKYDDGFVAYLNGTLVAQANTPASPAWNSSATASRSDASATVFQDFPITGYLSSVHSGLNVLAIQGLDYSASGTSRDFLILPNLEATTTAQAVGYLSQPSPGRRTARPTPATWPTRRPASIAASSARPSTWR